MKKYIIIVSVLIQVSCSVKERPINYGTDECAYCKMIMMDHRFGAELVTEKAKVYTFDAAECLIDYLHYNTEIAQASSLLLITPYTDPNTLFDATKASYLVSGEMPSPMGAYLNAFRDLETARSFQSTKGGKIYNWEELSENIKSIRLEAIREYE
jgi:copper chaperone NosL